jgi:hypothetical protein
VFPTSNAPKDLNSVHDHKMKAIMNIGKSTTIEELEHFIQGNQSVAFTVLGDKAAIPARYVNPMDTTHFLKYPS